MEHKKVFLLPGEYCITKSPTLISTLLGSCVSVILYNKKLKIGGMNHYMLPRSPGGASNTPKYGNYSTEMLVKFMKSSDTSLSNTEAMIIGGGHVVGHLNSGDGIARANIQMARDILLKHGIRVTKEDVGGSQGRKLYYQSWDNQLKTHIIVKSEYAKDVALKNERLSKNKIRTLIVDDSKLVRTIIKQALANDPEIEVVGEAADPFEGREKILELDPDVITLDIIMPKMDGISFLKKLMVYKPLPVIIVSTVAQKGSAQRARADQIGAFDIVDKEDLKLYQAENQTGFILSQKIKVAARAPIRKKSVNDIKHI